jgi:protein phosphatase
MDISPDTPRPTRADVDVFGLSHVGRVRTENQDHFLVASLHKAMQVHQSSLDHGGLGTLVSGSRGYVFLVADGVGGNPWGQQASGTALKAIADYVIHGMDLLAHPEADQETRLVAKLRRSLEKGHQALKAEGEAEGKRGMATTLTMVTIHWPRAYVIHVGDSRAYRMRDGHLEQITKDQTMAQAMVDAGALTSEAAEHSRLKHVLWSALGGKEALPEVISLDCEWEDVMLLCSDGLTKHVTDEEIQEYLTRMTSAEQVCRDLITKSLERGGSDNVTVVVGRLRRR